MNGYRGMVMLALFSAILWGIWWVPVRFLQPLGVSGLWAGICMSLASLPVLGLILLVRGGGASIGMRAAMGAMLVGTALMSYSIAIALTEVLKVVLLFYLAPAWSVAIECLFLGRRWTWRSTLALGASFLGLLVIMGGDLGTGSFGIGEAIALGSGLSWSIATSLIFTSEAKPPVRLSMLAVVGSLATAALAWLAFGDILGALPNREQFALAAPVAGLAGVFYMTPFLLMTMLASARLAPATLSFLLTAEILSGVVSSALFLDEPFGPPQVIGAFLVALGAVIEVIGPQTPRSPARPRA